MQTIWLPLLRCGEELERAIERMDGEHVSSAVVEHPDLYRLIFIGSVLEAMDMHIRELRELHEWSPLRPMRRDDVARYELDPGDPFRTSKQYERMLDMEGASYSLAAVDKDRVLVVTRHESSLNEMAQSNAFKCSRAPHYFPRPLVSSGDECPKCVGTPKGRISRR
jgi:hypothetical protein